MKIKINTNLIINGIVIGFVLLVVGTWASSYFSIGSGKTYHGVDTAFVNRQAYQWVDTLKPIEGEIPDSIQSANYKYKKLTDSIKTIRQMKNGEFFGSASQFTPLGTEACIYCDTCSLKWFWKKGFFSNDHGQYYFTLLEWKLKNSEDGMIGYPDSVVFHVEHGQSYVRKEMRFPKTHTAGLVDVPVKFRYNTRDDYLMIPISYSAKHVLDIILLAMLVIFYAGIFYLIAGFLKFIVDLLKGLFFSTRNIRRLKLIAFTLLIYPVAIFLLNFVLRLIFASYFIPDVTLKESSWQDSWRPIGIGLIFFALYRAFKQGKKLKEEQELTI